MSAYEELLIATLCRLIGDARRVAVGAASPIPAAAALLAEALSDGAVRPMILGSARAGPLSDGGPELFDRAGQGRIDVFFLGGGQIDGEANINLVGTGPYPQTETRFPGSFGAAYLYYAVPRVILFREEHSRRVLVRRVDFVSAPGASDPPLRGVIGSDVQRFRPDWKVVQNPVADEDDPVLVVPAIRPDFALFHAPLADARGNVWVGNRRELVIMAHAARATLVTAEEIVDADLAADERMAAGTIPAFYLDAVAAAPGGARPLGLVGCYEADAAALSDYAAAARSEAGFRRWLDHFVADGREAA